MAAKRRTSAKLEQAQRDINDYMAETGEEVVDMMKVADWRIKNGRWKPPRISPTTLCARELSRAARQEFYVDPQGRDVRKKHCFTFIDQGGQYRWLWFDIINADEQQMHKSAQARRRMALGDVSQLNTDISSFNDNNKYGAHIDMSFNFDEDLAEMEHPTVYPGDEEDEYDDADDDDDGMGVTVST
ncbi:MAG TPA: hypothetical protein VJZ71_10130 [Phycisphaerae bacterium]|nr:hypothetical protein [Phycisphaerae bacterium]